MRRVAALGFIVVAAAIATDARARRPLKADAWWSGLDHARGEAPARGVQTLRASPEGRVRIPGGHFVMGSSPTEMVNAVRLCEREVLKSLCEERSPSFRAEGMAHEVSLSPYMIDRTEVTVGAYRRCVTAGACAAPGFPPTDARFDRPDLPVTHVRWEDAGAYCKWTGGRLPTEAEWEYAARGATARKYPWGNVYNSRLCNHGSLAADDRDETDGFLGLAPVGSFPDGATPLGVLDMAGNVAEWVEDMFTLDDGHFGYPAASQTNPHVTSGLFHLYRGGSYEDAAPWQRSAARGWRWLVRGVILRDSTIGFRCAADAGG